MSINSFTSERFNFSGIRHHIGLDRAPEPGIATVHTTLLHPRSVECRALANVKDDPQRCDIRFRH